MQAATMAMARTNSDEASKSYFKVLKEGRTTFADIKDLYPDQSFWQWATAHYDELASAEKTRAAALTELYQAMQAYYGPDGTTLSTYITNIMTAQSANAVPGSVSSKNISS